MKVYVDGENFRHGLANVLMAEGLIANSRELTAFPLRQVLTDVLAITDLEIAYYTSKIKLPRGYKPSEAILNRASEINEFNRKWTAALLRQDIEHIKAGYLKVKSGEPCRKCGERIEILQEKGVDVRIAVDIVTQISRGKRSQLALMSSDTDLIPAIDRARKQGVHVVYVCFGEAVNRAVSASVDETITISNAKVAQYFKGQF